MIEIDKNMNRQELLITLYKAYLKHEISAGELIAYLRKNIFRMSQDKYAKYVGVSRRTLSSIEQNKDDLSISVFNKAIKPIGLKMGMISDHEILIQQIINTDNQNTE